jgi:predicted component of type VI protein secretion system
MIRVTIRRQDSSQDEVHEFTLPQITIGRVDRNHVVLPNNRVSSVHARVIENEEGIVLVDNNSTNGTFVNGEMVRGPVVLAPHDAVDVGVFTLHFERAEEGHEVQESYGAGPDFEEQAGYGEPGEYEDFQGGPEPIGEPPDLLLAPVEPTPADPIEARHARMARICAAPRSRRAAPSPTPSPSRPRRSTTRSCWRSARPPRRCSVSPRGRRRGCARSRPRARWSSAC